MYRERKEPEIIPCFVCETLAYRKDDQQTDVSLIICPICGKFRCDGAVAEYVARQPEFRSVSYKLSHYFRTIAERAFGKRDNSHFPVYQLEDFEKIENQNDPPLREKLQILLRYLASLSNFPGEELQFDAKHDYSVLCSKNVEEALFFLRALGDQDFVSVQWEMLDYSSVPCQVTAEGWQELERNERAGADSTKGFIAMRFDKSRDAAKDAIKEAISKAGYQPLRLDEFEHVNRIDDEVIAQIRQSKFLVADFTEQSNGVYFEAGFMLGLGRPVIWLCEKSDSKNLHFDTRQYNTIEYTGPEDLKKQLQTRIEAVLGKGPHKT